MTSEAVQIGMGLRILLKPTTSKAARAGRHPFGLRTAWILHILYILYSLEVGSFLIVFPWLKIWENNYILYRFPGFRPVVANSFMKGAILGLGLVNIFIGVQELVQIRKGPKGFCSK